MLREEDWLPKAKRLSVGMSMRFRHGNERRANLTIANDRDRYWAYCQACKQGGKLMKEHVLLAMDYVSLEKQMQRPTDMIRVLGSEWETVVARFLASKNMMFPYLPELWISPSYKRVFMQDSLGNWHGRDITEKSNMKWLHFGLQFSGEPSDTTIVTEDLFSMFKIQFALGSDITACSTLGAACGNGAALALKNCTHIVWAYDADKAGDDGFKQASKRMQVFVPKQSRARPPEGLDPKDMDCQAIRDLIKEVLNEQTNGSSTISGFSATNMQGS